MVYGFKQQNAFTLAEVLITLAIIGVVASLTIPSLIVKYQKQVTVEGYKKAYSTLVSAVKMSEAQNGAIEGWDFPTTYDDNNQLLDFLKIYILPYLSISKSCELNTNCFVKHKRPNGEFSNSSSVQYVLNDGTAIAFFNMGFAHAPTTAGKISIYVDINGSKNPNTMGKDVFLFLLAPKAASYYNGGNGDLARNVKIGGLYPDGYGVNITGIHYQYRGCGKDVTYGSAGAYCGMKIIQDGYQIKEDYPW